MTTKSAGQVVAFLLSLSLVGILGREMADVPMEAPCRKVARFTTKIIPYCRRVRLRSGHWKGIQKPPSVKSEGFLVSVCGDYTCVGLFPFTLFRTCFAYVDFKYHLYVCACEGVVFGSCVGGMSGLWCV